MPGFSFPGKVESIRDKGKNIINSIHSNNNTKTMTVYDNKMVIVMMIMMIVMIMIIMTIIKIIMTSA